MTAGNEPHQRIARLTPLAHVLAHIDAHVKPVAPRRIDVSIAQGMILSEDAIVPEALPARAIALRDGFAVDSESVRDATAYAPAELSSPPVQVEVGEPLPAGADAVLPADAVSLRGGGADALSSAPPGDGVLPPGIDAKKGASLLRAGKLLTAGDVAVLRAANLKSVSVRTPTIGIARVRRDDVVLTAAMEWLADAIAAAGGRVVRDEYTHAIGSAHRDADEIDAIVAVGGTGSGRHDNAVTDLAHFGQLLAHGIAIAPGDTAAFGFSAARPVLLIPGRLDAAIACWLLIGQHLVARLSGHSFEEAACTARLTRKISSALGITQMVPVARDGEAAEPLGATYLPLQAMARANGWILVPAQSEGFAAGSKVFVRPFP